jgi:hypothetical protein
MAGYSGTPLAQKLGIKPGSTVALIDPPSHYAKLLGKEGREVKLTDRIQNDSPFIHLFVRRRIDLQKQVRRLRTKIADTGVLWISWPKKTSGVSSDVTEDVIRDVALPLGFVDVKVCAVDETWSGLKLMIRREHRS